MECRIHRVVGNDCHWTRPSPGRFGKDGFGDYVKQNGFGHEDWNFDLSLARDGFHYGYTSATPPRDQIGRPLNLVLATCEGRKWQAVGCYLGARFVEGVRQDPDVLARKRQDVEALPGSSRLTGPEIEQALTVEPFLIRVATKDIRIFTHPVPLPDVMMHNRWRFRTSYPMDEGEFQAILETSDLYERQRPKRSDDSGLYEEGQLLEATHRHRERNQRLVAEFKRSLSSFDCSCCGFSFGAAYGEIGEAYIEAHHTKRVSDMKPGEKTRVEVLVAVCANCHRMIHSRIPMLSPDDLRAMVLNHTQRNT
ncbi:HNH endonuclease [Mameliella sp. CS4]|uniref:HNH endonuclease n=1 Tax=Mameliella sp. CS4 TaxID=2862329 RepID=UPI001C5E2D55|nr:HNH endonuclease [Mameliella sp. CS4]MBW4984854.1 HNH endonuclease [Mameliella sp. CS4]